MEDQTYQAVQAESHPNWYLEPNSEVKLESVDEAEDVQEIGERRKAIEIKGMQCFYVGRKEGDELRDTSNKVNFSHTYDVRSEGSEASLTFDVRDELGSDTSVKVSDLELDSHPGLPLEQRHYIRQEPVRETEDMTEISEEMTGEESKAMQCLDVVRHEQHEINDSLSNVNYRYRYGVTQVGSEADIIYDIKYDLGSDTNVKKISDFDYHCCPEKPSKMKHECDLSIENLVDVKHRGKVNELPFIVKQDIAHCNDEIVDVKRGPVICSESDGQDWSAVAKRAKEDSGHILLTDSGNTVLKLRIELNTAETPSSPLEGNCSEALGQSTEKSHLSEQEQLLRQNSTTHTEGTPHVCDTFQYTCNKTGQIKEQKMVHRNGEKLYSCDMCQYISKDTRSLKKHKMTHTNEKSFSCNLCPYKSRWLGNLKRHLMVHLGEKPYASDICQYTCREEAKLKMHKLKRTSKMPLSCDMCHYRCAYLSVMKKHLMKHTYDRLYACDVCQYTCIQAQNFKKHLMKHTAEKRHSRKMGQFANIHHGNLKIYVKKFRPERSYSCDICQYKSKNLTKLKMHLMIHTDEKPFPCNLCPYKGRQLINLKRHFMIHTGEKPFSCDMCQYACREEARLKIHKLKHSGEMPYSCDMCQYRCAFMSILKKHLMKHTDERPYACDICPYTCKNDGRLKQHKMTHSRERPYSCNVCQYTCIQSWRLKMHSVKHTA